mgnify:CR=1 FL=1
MVQEEKRKNIMTGKGIAEKIFCRKMQKRLQRIEQRETATDVVIITSAAVFLGSMKYLDQSVRPNVRKHIFHFSSVA